MKGSSDKGGKGGKGGKGDKGAGKDTPFGTPSGAGNRKLQH